MRKVVIATLALAGFIGVASTAQALPINCPGTALTTDREFTLDTTPSSSCLATGNGNINGNGDAIDLLGYITLDKSDDDTTGALLGALTITGTGTSGGTFSILPSTFLSYNSLVIAFKSGNGPLNPDWAAFLLAPGALSGTWAISGQQSLSHAILYGKLGPTQTVPEPTSLLLLGASLVSVTLRARRRKA
jgi:hypothetical protein